MTSTSMISNVVDSWEERLEGMNSIFRVSNPLLESSEYTTLIPSVSTVTKNYLNKYTTELKDSADSLLPRMSGLQSTRNAFRVFFIEESVHAFDFLDRPIEQNKTVSKAVKIVQRFGRKGYNPSLVRIRDLCLDICCNDVLDSVQDSLDSNSEKDSLSQWILQARKILDLWKLTIGEMRSVEKRLEAQCLIFDDAYKRARILLDLPSTMNKSYETLLDATHIYIQQIFDENKIEEIFEDYCKVLKKLSVLTDTMKTIRLFINSPTEPVCTICITEPVSMTFVPCGHTVCLPCAQRQSLNCHVCRSNIREKVKIYFS